MKVCTRVTRRVVSHLFTFYEDLHTLLTEVNGDVQVAAARITEGALCSKKMMN